MNQQPVYAPNFTIECQVCATKPTVVVIDHVQPNTELCGPCFFGEHMMVDWELWNDAMDATE